MSIVKINREENAIKEAAITIFLAQPILNFDKFKSGFDNAFGKKFFELTQPKSQVKVNIKNEQGVVSSDVSTNESVGFDFIKHENGEPSIVFQMLNELENPVYSYHALNYIRWSNFIQTFKEIIEPISSIQKQFFIKGFSLNYVDEFIWQDNSEIDLGKIIQQNEYMPNNFFKIKEGLLANARQIESNEKEIIYDRLEILVNSKFQKTIQISQNQTIFKKEFIDLKENNEMEKMLGQLVQLHEKNKDFLKAILLPEIQKLIKLI